MNILIISTSERAGGAAVAASRLAMALNDNGVKAKMLVRDKQTDRLRVIDLPKSWKLKFNFVWERFCIWIANKFSRENLFAVSIANSGTDITHLPDFQKADIIHLHWINQGMLSLKNIQKIIASGKPVVWTMHDMWNMTGICHYAGDCEQYKSARCTNCSLISGSYSKTIFKQKEKLYAHSKIAFIACSQWLERIANGSDLLEKMNVTNIPNAINTNLFLPAEKSELRKKYRLPEDKKLLLFGSMKLTDKRKGIEYLIEACQIFTQRYAIHKENIGIVMMGNRSEEIANLLPFPVYSVGFLTKESEITAIYNASDLYVTPSIEDNLPNTIMEALACGTPCVGFNVGGIPEMIDHRQNGYVAEYKSAEDLAAGIYWSLFEANTTELRENARQKVLCNYSEDIIAKRYIELYESLLKKPK